jgi:hypothetical protein
MAQRFDEQAGGRVVWGLGGPIERSGRREARNASCKTTDVWIGGGFCGH